MKELIISLTGQFNAACKHCCFECSPEVNEKIDKEYIYKLLDYGISNEKIKSVAITGGEPFLEEALLMDMLLKLQDANKKVTCITNGYWAQTEEIAYKKLKRLTQAGLSVLTVSHDDFHKEYIPTYKIKNLFKAARHLPLEIHLNMSVTESNLGNSILAELGKTVLGVNIVKFPVVEVGSCKNIPKKELIKFMSSENSMPCPSRSAEMMVNYDGYVYPCCSPTVFEGFLRVGNIYDKPIERIEKDMKSNIFIYIIKKEGLDWFYKTICENNLFELKKYYASPCDLCLEIFSSISHLEILKPYVDRYYERIL